MLDNPVGMLEILTPGSWRQAEFESRAGVSALAVMAKAPRPGTVKTRLCPPLTQEQAAALNMCFLRDTAEHIAAITSGSSEALSRVAGLVCYTPVGDEQLFECLLPNDFALLAQRGDGFGERLLGAAEDILACGYSSVCLIDSDSPTVPTAAYEMAVTELARPGNRIVMGSAADGGYYLIGMKQAHAAIFADISWSIDRVAEETRARAQAAGIELIELPLWYDVDDAATLAILKAELLAGMPPGFAMLPGYPAPHTREFLLAQDLPPSIASEAKVPDSTSAASRNEESWEDAS
jgi:rSAM/selenodomain-associated transferase 1